MRAFVDSDHASESVTRHSRLIFIVLLNSVHAFASCKKQGRFKTSSFGSELIAIKSCCEHLRCMCCKIRMFGMPVKSLACVLGDNQHIVSDS